jgi:hypothetical protein
MPTLESTDIQQAHQYFDETLGRILDVTAGLSKSQWLFKPAPDRWSIAENLEHMVTVEERVLGPVRDQLVQAPAPPANRDNQQIDAIVLERIPDRSLKAKAPEFIDPTGTWTQSDCLDRLSRNYQRLADLVESSPDLRDHILDAPPLKFVTNGAYETMDGYQWALAVAAHDERHVRQILELKNDPNYPVG